ncbi:hypothetical protein [Phenylobacterium sp.]|uniref:hypothetical protein n=1 Tax=Phenylobacterium sp. TaxID=1871053 RepID=UPI00120AC6D8|nr:hypothetical protein [Phenylobacterium sp.]THD60196.1 MAG: hypothetical protein E8A49_14600 [Phenylobacterium sp.]
MLHVDMADAGPLFGVAVGAVLATMGGLLGGQIENRLNRKEREQSAALLFGEILTGLRLTIRLADESRGRGDPYGPITMRVIKAAVRETQIYERNRETLFAIRDPQLRAKTHILLVQMSLTLEAVQEAQDAIKASPHAVEAAMAEREGSFNFALELYAELPPLIVQFEKLAGQTFEAPDVDLTRNLTPRPA